MIYRFTLLLTILIASTSAVAMTLPDLNTATISMNEHGQQKQLDTLFTQGLQQAIIKISGNPDVISVPAVQDALHHAKDWVSSYSNKEINNKSYIYILYDEASIKHLLKETKQSIWGNKRPLTLIWLVAEDGHITTTDQNDGLRTIIKQTADQRGLPVLFPAPDVDNYSNNTSTLISQNNNTLSATDLNNSYHTDATLMGNIESTDAGKIVHWHYTDKNETLNWTNTGLTTELITQKGINELANTLADQEAILHNEGLKNAYYLYINNVNSTQDYSNIKKELKSSSNIDSFEIQQIQNNQLKIRITSPQTATTLTKIISREPNLKLNTNQPTNDNSTTFIFDWDA
jgi:uncharacterized protein